MEKTLTHLTDSYGRTIRDLRISLTDRCNFRCFYCLPNGEPPLAKKEKILTFEEILTATRVFVSLGIRKVRLTGGEPLLRKDVEELVSQIAQLKPALKDLALTTNGHTFPERASALRAAGLDRVTISLDSLKKKRFKEITGVDRLENVIKSIDVAKSNSLNPVKINVVMVRGVNDDEIIDFARFAREMKVSVRFIEFMPLDSGQDWKREKIVSGEEIRKTIDAKYPLNLKEPNRGSRTAWNYIFDDGAEGEIGIIAPVTQIFCGACSRIRLTADGQIRTCLFSETEYNLRDVIRSASNDQEIAAFLQQVVNEKEFSHRINEKEFVQPSRTMSFIGG